MPDGAPEDDARINVIFTSKRLEDVLVGNNDVQAAGSNVFEAQIEPASFTDRRSTCALTIGDLQIFAEQRGAVALFSKAKR